MICAASAIPFLGCARTHGPIDEDDPDEPEAPVSPAEAPDDVPIAEALPAREIPDAEIDGGVDATPDAPPDLRVAESFTLLLADYGCTRHAHIAVIDQGTWEDDEPINVLNSYHEVYLRPSELVRLESGERLAFATSGGESLHGHCGLAWRSDADPFDDYRSNTPEEPSPGCLITPEPACF